MRRALRWSGASLLSLAVELASPHLTGRAPFRGESIATTLDLVRDQEPVPPGRINNLVDRDLETICLKCLAKGPGRRYDSAQALAEDLERYLRGEPILARPVGPWERAAKWVRRRPAAAALLIMSGVAVLALVGVAVGAHYNRQLRAANREISAPKRLLVTHFFNHQTHHRGQAHALITAAGEKTDDTDLFLVVPQMIA